MEMAELGAEKELGVSNFDKDKDELARLGKKQVLKVRILQNCLNTRSNLSSEISALCRCWASAVR